MDKRVLIGHSKGASLAICVASEHDTVVCLGARFQLQVIPRAFYSSNDMLTLQGGGTIQKSFGGYQLSVDQATLDELESYDFKKILNNK